MEIKGKLNNTEFRVFMDEENAQVECENEEYVNFLENLSQDVFNPQTMNFERTWLQEGLLEAYLVLVQLKRQGFSVELTELPEGLIPEAEASPDEVY